MYLRLNILWQTGQESESIPESGLLDGPAGLGWLVDRQQLSDRRGLDSGSAVEERSRMTKKERNE